MVSTQYYGPLQKTNSAAELSISRGTVLLSKRKDGHRVPYPSPGLQKCATSIDGHETRARVDRR